LRRVARLLVISENERERVCGKSLYRPLLFESTAESAYEVRAKDISVKSKPKECWLWFSTR